jgi:hypothetical protein
MIDIKGTWWLNTAHSLVAIVKQENPPSGRLYSERDTNSETAWLVLDKKSYNTSEESEIVDKLPFDKSYFDPGHLYKIVITDTGWTYEEYA